MDVDLIVIRETERLVITAPGPQGPPGIPGGSYYQHIQSAPASTWIIDHNLGIYIGVTVFINGVIQYADSEQGTPNQTTITFPSPVAGRATFP